MADPKVKKEILKELIKRLHAGANPEEIKKQFKATFQDVGPTEIAQAEEELIKEGMPKEEIHRLCDVHIAAMQEALERGSTLAPIGHPIHTLMEEHELLIKFSEELKTVAGRISASSDYKTHFRQLEQAVQHFKDSVNHYLREENVLFPYLEKHGITQPPAIMWMEHDKIREIEKGLYQLIESRDKIKFEAFAKQLNDVAAALAEILSGHFYKENNILFPASLRVIGEDEWHEIVTQFEEVGFCPFTPDSGRKRTASAAASVSKEEAGVIHFDTGSFAPELLEVLLNTLPVDISFVDQDDVVRYYSQSKDRIFVRTKAVIGRTVQQCHPEKSVHVVNQILADFKAGKRDISEFWINMNDRLIYIRYFPVRSKTGDYLGCLEVTQDVTDIQKLKGEKRLL